MKEIFKQMEAKVEQNVVDKQCANIERKNLLIQNENLIANWLSNEVLYSVMHDGNINIELTEKVTALQEHNQLFRAENEKVKQHYKELYNSIKITRAKTIEKTTSLLTENEKRKAQLKGKIQCVTMPAVKPKVLAPGVISSTEASGSKPRMNTKNTRILSARSDNMNKVEDHPWNNKSNLKQKNRVDCSISSKHTIINSNSNYVCKTRNKCLKFANHDKCVVKYLTFVNAPPFVKDLLGTVKQVWKETGKLFVNVVYQWKPTGRKIALGEQCPLTRFTKSKVVPLQQPKHVSSSKIVITEKLNNTSQKPLTRYEHRNKQDKAISTRIPITAETQTIDAFVKYTSVSVVQTILWNDHFGAIMGYGAYVIGDSVISRVYYVEGLGQNLISVGQFCDLDLEVAFRKHSCYVRNEDGVELLKDSRGSNLYTISIKDMMKSYLICLLSKASKNKSWLWHRWLNHLNIGTINDLAQKDLVRGLPRLKFEKDHLCSACQLGKSKKYTHKPKSENTIMKVLNTLHMDLCGPMRVKASSPKISSENSSVEWRCRKTESNSCGSFSDKADIFKSSDVSMGRTCTPSFTFHLSRLPQSTSNSPSSFVVQPPISHQGVATRPTIEYNPFAQADNDPFVNVFAPEPSSDESSSGDVSSAEST
ncbi:retrovirus-related pol polyprotein from transposon TNT 1-94 [Tanacetum coccineum]